MRDRSSFENLNSQGVPATAAALGLETYPGGGLGPCPCCGATHRERGRARGPIGVTADGKGWRCHRCQQGGDPVALLAATVTGEARPLNWDRVGQALGDLNLEGSSRPTRNRLRPSTDYPSLAEVQQLYGACGPLAGDEAALEWAKSRHLEGGQIDSLDLARVLPPGAPLPRWAQFRGQPWSLSQHRLIFPLYDGMGSLRSVRARSLNPQAEPAAKAAAPKGYRVGGLFMACPGARALLSGRETGPADKLLVAEGGPDFLTRRLTMSADCAVIGIFAGSVSGSFETALPVEVPIYLGTHWDEAGERYAAKIRASLPNPCFRLRPIPRQEPTRQSEGVAQ